MLNDKIIIHGARAHNLKNVDVTIPRDKLVVMTDQLERLKDLLAGVEGVVIRVCMGMILRNQIIKHLI